MAQQAIQIHEAQQPLLVKGKASILVSHPFDEAE